MKKYRTDAIFSDYGNVNKEYSREELANIYRQIISDIEDDFEKSDIICSMPLPFKIGERVTDATEDIYVVTGFELNEYGLSMSCYKYGTNKEDTEEFGLNYKNFEPVIK